MTSSILTLLLALGLLAPRHEAPKPGPWRPVTIAQGVCVDYFNERGWCGLKNLALADYRYRPIRVASGRVQEP